MAFVAVAAPRYASRWWWLLSSVGGSSCCFSVQSDCFVCVVPAVAAVQLHRRVAIDALALCNSFCSSGVAGSVAVCAASRPTKHAGWCQLVLQQPSCVCHRTGARDVLRLLHCRVTSVLRVGNSFQPVLCVWSGFTWSEYANARVRNLLASQRLRTSVQVMSAT
jgi:hypothetical protein